jgi:hypothetical protein
VSPKTMRKPSIGIAKPLKNYAAAQTSLGVAYESGLGVPKDDAQAIYWYRNAAQQNNPEAQNNLGWMYQNGHGVSKDDAQAIFWYRKAAEQGLAIAQNNLNNLKSLAARDPSDVVAQVLNYTSFGKDEGYGDSFWYKETSGKCHYRLHDNANPSNLRNFIDLDELDPKNITFRYIPFMNTGTGTIIIQHDTQILFSNLMNLNLERLKRGWALIYNNYCTGTEKPF